MLSSRTFLYTFIPRRGIRNARHNADAALRANEHSVPMSEQAVARIDCCQLPANRPIEDYYSVARCLSSSAFLFGVFDGHGGAYCSRHVSTRLFDYVAASVLAKHQLRDLPVEERLEWLYVTADPHLPVHFRSQHLEALRHYHNRFVINSELSTVRKALQEAFVSLDEDMARGAMPDPTGRVDKMSANVIASGSCATLAHVRGSHLHVANVGDSAAVLGVVSNTGNVSARLLSRAHCVENADEVARIRSAHPASEAQVLHGGRLLGELYPLRAFGDVRYKWPLSLQKVVLEPLGCPPPMHLHTPPYLSAQPEVFYHKLTPNDKFLILASDGLWEWLDPDTVVRLVHDHTLGMHTLTPYEPKSGLKLREVHAELQLRKAGNHKKPLDDNTATHIIRHALGGVSGGTKQQYQRLTDALQVPAGMARTYRDDISIIVVHFSEEYLQDQIDDTQEYTSE